MCIRDSDKGRLAPLTCHTVHQTFKSLSNSINTKARKYDTGNILWVAISKIGGGGNFARVYGVWVGSSQGKATHCQLWWYKWLLILNDDFPLSCHTFANPMDYSTTSDPDTAEYHSCNQSTNRSRLFKTKPIDKTQKIMHLDCYKHLLFFALK